MVMLVILEIAVLLPVILLLILFIGKLGAWGGSSETPTFREEIGGLPPNRKTYNYNGIAYK